MGVANRGEKGERKGVRRWRGGRGAREMIGGVGRERV